MNMYRGRMGTRIDSGEPSRRSKLKDAFKAASPEKKVEMKDRRSDVKAQFEAKRAKRASGVIIGKAPHPPDAHPSLGGGQPKAPAPPPSPRSDPNYTRGTGVNADGESVPVRNKGKR